MLSLRLVGGRSHGSLLRSAIRKAASSSLSSSSSSFSFSVPEASRRMNVIHCRVSRAGAAHFFQVGRDPRSEFRRCFVPSCRSPKDEEKKKKKSPPPRSRRADLLDRTVALRAKIRSSLSNLHPRENIYNLPNVLTFSRLVAAPAVGYLVLHGQHAWALGLFIYAGVTDLVDGWVARRWKLQTVVGSVVDPMADKMLMTVLVGCLAIKGALPLWLATLILGRDASLALAAIYFRWASLPPPKTFARYWDFSLPSASVHPTTISKLNTFLQLALTGATMALPLVVGVTLSPSSSSLLSSLAGVDVGTATEAVVCALQFVVAGTTLWSGGSYAWNRDAVRIMGPDDEARKHRRGRRGRAIIGFSFASFVGLAIWLAQWEERVKIRDS